MSKGWKVLAICIICSMYMLTGCVSGESGESTAVQEPENTETDDGQGFVFIKDGTAIAVNADMEPILEQLGEPDSYFEAASCAFEGLDKYYTYNGFQIITYPVEDKDYISAVILKNDIVTTQEGIRIGDDLNKVKETYGEDYGEEYGKIFYEKDEGILNFILEEDTVISIEYRRKET